MSRNGDVELDFGGQKRVFRLGVGELEKLQEKTDAGPGELIQRLSPWMRFGQARKAAVDSGGKAPDVFQAAQAGLLGAWRVQDIRETLRQGLIGGGLDIGAADKVIQDYVDGRPVLESAPAAFSVLWAAVVGAEDEEAAGEFSGEGSGSPNLSPQASSGSESTASMPSEGRADSPRKRSAR